MPRRFASSFTDSARESHGKRLYGVLAKIWGLQ
jgi:hypothetical protein